MRVGAGKRESSANFFLFFNKKDKETLLQFQKRLTTLTILLNNNNIDIDIEVYIIINILFFFNFN